MTIINEEDLTVHPKKTVKRYRAKLNVTVSDISHDTPVVRFTGIGNVSFGCSYGY